MNPSVMAPVVIVAILVIRTARTEIRHPGSAREQWAFAANRRAAHSGAAVACVIGATGWHTAGYAALAWAVLAGALVAYVVDHSLRPGTVAPRDARVVRNEIVLLGQGDTVLGRLRFRACRTCRTGRVLDIWVHDAWQRRGLGHELIHTLLAHHPDHGWTTTLQTRQGRAFFAAMAQETATPFPHRAPLCDHLAVRPGPPPARGGGPYTTG